MKPHFILTLFGAAALLWAAAFLILLWLIVQGDHQIAYR
jgi:hypothetical protein